MMKASYATSLYLLITCLTFVNGIRIESASKSHSHYCITAGPVIPPKATRRQLESRSSEFVKLTPSLPVLDAQGLNLGREGEILTAGEKSKGQCLTLDEQAATIRDCTGGQGQRFSFHLNNETKSDSRIFIQVKISGETTTNTTEPSCVAVLDGNNVGPGNCVGNDNALWYMID